MYYDSTGMAHQDHAGESVPCAMINCLTLMRRKQSMPTVTHKVHISCRGCGQSWDLEPNEEGLVQFKCLRCYPITVSDGTSTTTTTEDYYPEQTAMLREILEAQIALIVKKDNDYRGSWKRRGGRGAWYTMVRPLDRLEQMIENKYGGDIFKGLLEEDAAGKTGADGSIVACFRDARSYMLLCEAWLLLQKNPYTVGVFANAVGREVWKQTVRGETATATDAKPVCEWWCGKCRRVIQAPDIEASLCPMCSCNMSRQGEGRKVVCNFCPDCGAGHGTLHKSTCSFYGRTEPNVLR